MEVILHLDTFFKDCQMPQQLHLHPSVLLSVSSTLLSHGDFAANCCGSFSPRSRPRQEA